MSLYYMAPHINAERLAYELGYSYADLYYYFDTYEKDERSYPFYPRNVSPNPDEKEMDNDIFALLCDWHLELEDVIYIDF